jgi:hypothetical protein
LHLHEIITYGDHASCLKYAYHDRLFI